MVHSLDDSPLALLRLARSEAEVELRKSLAKASMLALTLCVTVLLARALFLAPAEFRIVPTPPWLPPDHRFEAPPTPQGDFVPPAPPKVVDPNSTFQPVDHEVDLPKVEDPPPNAPPAVGNGSGTGEVRPGTGDTPAPPAPEPDPVPGAQFVEHLPDPVTKVVPAYPPIARDAGMEGRVTVRMLVGADGRVLRAEIEKSSPMFDEEALKAARQWTFTPATTNGHAVKAWVWVPFQFRLRD